MGVIDVNGRSDSDVKYGAGAVISASVTTGMDLGASANKIAGADGFAISASDKACVANAIEIRDYSFRYAGSEYDVLSRLNLTVDYGEFVVLSGDSGSGKSTLLASLIGSIPHIYAGDRSGRIFVDGRDVTDERIASRARLVGSVLQDADSQIVHARVGDEIAFGCENLGMSPEDIGRRADDAARSVKLDTGAFTRTLSGGQKQRLITASALAMGRKILLLDEPLANLDGEAAEFLLGTLRALARQGHAILLAEHRLETALPYANRHLNLTHGICEEAETEHKGEHKGDGSFCVDRLEAASPEHKRDGSFCVDRLEAASPEHKGDGSFCVDRLEAASPYADKHTRLADERCVEAETAYSEEHKKNRPLCAPKKNRPLCAPHLACSEDDAVFILDNITYQTGGRMIIAGASFYMKRGERVVILGENGCGKTTLLRMLARLIRPTSGVVEQRVAPGSGRRASPKWFGKVGYVYQNPNYQLFMPTVLDEIAYKAADTAAARSYADMFGLSKLLERHPHSLSEGQKRRLGVAAVCAARPKVLLLDEPTVGQDDESLGRMIEALNYINSEYGTTLVTVTHDSRCAGALADRTLCMRGGRVVGIN
jgi:energy-coupling factor transport system ATP-binding protein